MRDPRPQNFPPPRADVKLLRVREIECSFQPNSEERKEVQHVW